MFRTNRELEAATYHALSTRSRSEAEVTLSPEDDELDELYEEILTNPSLVSSLGSTAVAVSPFPSPTVGVFSMESMTGLHRVHSWDTLSQDFRPCPEAHDSSESDFGAGNVDVPITPSEWLVEDTDTEWGTCSDTTVPETASEPTDPQDDLLAIVPITGKGQGVIARTHIRAGTCILQEAASIRINLPGESYVPPQSQFDRLSNEDRAKVLALHNVRDILGPVLGIIWTNAIPLHGLYPQCGLFITASRFNHACNPNAMHTWDKDEEVLLTYALRDIEEGEEITSKYFSDLGKFENRQAHLESLFGFTCTCSLCSLGPKDRAASDDRIQKIINLQHQLDVLRPEFQRLPILKKIREILELYHEEGIMDHRPRDAYDLAEKVSAKAGDWRRFVVFSARRAAREAIWGESRDPEEEKDKDHAIACRHLARSEWGQTRGRGGGFWPPAPSKEFEDWLFDEQTWVVAEREHSQAGELALDWYAVSAPAPEEWDRVRVDYELIQYI